MRLEPLTLAEAILLALEGESGVEVLINDFGSGLASVRMEEGHLWALSAPPQVKASFAATRACLSLLRQRRGLVINLGLGPGPADQHCLMRHAMLGFAHSLGLMEMNNVEMADLCLHNLYGQQPGRCTTCAADAPLTAPASGEAMPFEHLYLARNGQVGELFLRVLDRSAGTRPHLAGSDETK